MHVARVREAKRLELAPTDRAELWLRIAKSFRKSVDVRRRTRWVTSLVERARPHDSRGSGLCMPRKSSAGRARTPSLEHLNIFTTLTVSDDIIADGVSLLNVVRMLGPGEAESPYVCTEC